MIPLQRINKLELVSIIKTLNDSGLLEEAIPVIAYTKPELIQMFSYAVERLPEEQLPEIAKEMYNYIYQDEDVNGKRFVAKLLKKVSCWGAVEGNQTYILDEMIVTGGFTLEEMARAVCSNKARVRRHLHERKHEFKHHYLVYNGKYYIKPNEEEDCGIQENKRVVREFNF